MRIIHPAGPMGFKAEKERHTPAERKFYAWLHDRCTCCLTGQPDFDIAHTGGLAEGKGMGRKAALWTCLPLIRPLHVLEERNRARFWSDVGLPDYRDWAVRLHDIFTKDDDPRSLLADMQARADRGFIVAALRGAA